MTVLPFGEVFGYPVDDTSQEAILARRSKLCPFRNVRCNKVSRTDPLGVCSLSDGRSLTTVCPFRFREKNRLFLDAARLVFGAGGNIRVAGEIRVLRLRHQPTKKIGKIDYLIARETSNGALVDFAAIEVQSVYISGASIRSAFNRFLQTGSVREDAGRRPDFRSSAQKRLMPQLGLKVPVFRRWGKKFFVAVDKTFFDALPPFKSVESFANSEITWLVYPFSRNNAGQPYRMGAPQIIFSDWKEIESALREGIPPEPEEILEEIRRHKGTFRLSI